MAPQRHNDRQQEQKNKSSLHLLSDVNSRSVVAIGVLAMLLAGPLLTGSAAAAATQTTDTTQAHSMANGFLLQADTSGFICIDEDAQYWENQQNAGTATDTSNQTFLGELLQTFLTFVTITGVPVFILLYQLDGILEFFALGADTKQAIKQHQRNLWIAAGKVYLLPMLIYFTVSTTDIINPPCIDLIAWL